LGLRQTRIQRSGENYIMRSLMIGTPHQFFLCDQIEKNDVGGACSTLGERRGVYSVLVEKPEGKRALSRLRRRWEDNIKMDKVSHSPTDALFITL
jgi:hypothetical protein